MNKNMQRESVIYALHDGQGNFGYIGSTRVNPKTRWWEHRSRARSGHSAPVYVWMRQVGIEKIDIEVLENIPEGIDPHVLEVVHIKQMLELGHPIQNQIGRDGVPHSNNERMKKLLSEKRRGKPTWIKGKSGLEAGWTDERRQSQRERFQKTREKMLSK